MTRLPPGAGDAPFNQPGDEEDLREMQVEEPRRAASLTLRSDDELREQRMASMEAANTSLADALRITYRLIQVVMVAMVLLFVFSGMQQVSEGETGIKVRMGRVVESSLEPGFQLSLPYPLGQIIKVDRSQKTLTVDDAFWFYQTSESKVLPLDQQGMGVATLNPEREGSLLTADGALAHARFTVSYHVEEPDSFQQNVYRPIDPRGAAEAEEKIVRAAVERAIVRVIATVTIDELIQRGAAAAAAAEAQTGGQPGEGTIEARVARIAQESLDAIDAGISIDTVAMREVTPPLRTRDSFRLVQDAVTKAGQEREKAEADAAKALNEAAGGAADPLLRLIAQYEEATLLKDKAKADALLSEMWSIMEGRAALTPTDAIAQRRTAGDLAVSGEVARVISDAVQYRSTVAAKAKADADSFRAKLAQYRSNPGTFVIREWSGAISALLARNTVESFLVPDNSGPLVLRLNSDPDILRRIKEEQYKKEIESNWRRREAMNEGR